MTVSIRMGIVRKLIERIRISRRIRLSRRFRGRIRIDNREPILTIVTFLVFINSLNHNLRKVQMRLGRSMCVTSIGRMWRRVGRLVLIG